MSDEKKLNDEAVENVSGGDKGDEAYQEKFEKFLLLNCSTCYWKLHAAGCPLTPEHIFRDVSSGDDIRCRLHRETL